MSSLPPEKPPASDQPKGYQPSTGRKLFMLAICVVGLLIVWIVYFFQSQQKP
ncbi:MAG TPA: hypothetical protein VEV17_18125 [Bryobacteraceae bacterium]|nr:hypothetical protein [Bryobacteraceae bacterium]